ncbi:MAG: hypothetical protein ACT4TC_09745 [Myxococcaceae bacterium]
MARILLELEPELAKALDRVAPAQSRKRSRFIRLAIQRALMDLEEINTQEAYRQQPEESVALLAEAWDEWKPRVPRRKTKR